MSQENVERIKAGFAAHNRGDLDALVEVYDPEAVFETLLLEPTMATSPYAGSTPRTKRPCRATTSSPSS